MSIDFCKRLASEQFTYVPFNKFVSKGNSTQLNFYGFTSRKSSDLLIFLLILLYILLFESLSVYWLLYTQLIPFGLRQGV